MLRIERTNLCAARGRGDFLIQLYGTFPLDRHTERQIEQASPPMVLLPRIGSKLGAPCRVPPTHAANQGPGYLERLPVGRLSGEDLGLNSAMDFHWRHYRVWPELYAETFDMQPQSLFPAYKPVPHLEMVRRT